MQAPQRIVIIGGGLAGATAAFALRKAGFEGDVTLVSQESEPPYERPLLSKTYLRGEDPVEKAYVQPEPDYAAANVELLPGHRAVTVDPIARSVNLDDGRNLSYDALLLATGVEARRFSLPGAELDGIHYLRTISDADALRAAVATPRRVVVIGGGWIGSEAAASLRQIGNEVTMVMLGELPLVERLGPELGQVYADLHNANGVRLVQGQAASFDGRGHVERVRLADGRTLDTDLVVAGIGAVSRLHIATRAGLVTTAGGIATDEFLRTSVPSIYAAGDVAAAFHPRYGKHVRVEHWDNAKRQGRAAALNMLGANEPYARTPYFYSDQFDLGMEYRGHAPQWGQVVIRGDLASRKFCAFWLADGRVIAAMNANVWDQGKQLAALVASERRVDLAHLADPSSPLLEAA